MSESEAEAETGAESLPSAWIAQPWAGGFSASSCWRCGCRWSWRSGRTWAWGLSSAAGAAFSACEGELDMGRTSGAAERLRGRIDSEEWLGVRRSGGCRGGNGVSARFCWKKTGGTQSSAARWGVDGWRPLNLQALFKRVQVQEPPGRRCCSAAAIRHAP